MNDIKVGDRVKVTQYRRHDDYGNGRIGVVLQIDTDDVPFLVKTEDYGQMWASEVCKLDTATGTDREALVTRAKELLAGTPHTVADIIAMASFLAGE